MAHIGNVMVAAMRHASSNLALSSSNACLAQLAERRLDKADVVRSNRTTGTTHDRQCSKAGELVSKTDWQGSIPWVVATTRKVAGEANRRAFEMRWLRKQHEGSNPSSSAESISL